MKVQHEAATITSLPAVTARPADRGERQRASLNTASADGPVVTEASIRLSAAPSLAAALRSTKRHVGRGGLCSVCAYLETLSRADAKALSQALAVGGPPAGAIIAVLDEHDPEHRLTKDRVNNHRYGHRARRVVR